MGRVAVVARNGGDHADFVSVYLVFVEPGGSADPGGCSPGGITGVGAATLAPRDTLRVAVDVPWQCADPLRVDGLRWAAYAIADVHGDDLGLCATVAQVLDGSCSAALADDDDDASDDVLAAAGPRVVVLSP